MAARYLRARRSEGFISVIAWFSLIGIALGVATLIIVMSVMNGFRAELLDRILGLNGHATVQDLQGGFEDYASAADRLKRVPGVLAADPLVEGQVMAMANGQAVGALVRGLRPGDLAERQLIVGNLKAGSLRDFGPRDGVLVGTRLAFRLGLRVGDQITVVAPLSNVTPFGAVPRTKSYPIAALFEVGMYEYDSSFVFVPLEAAQVFFRTGDRVSGIEVFVDRPDRIAAMRLRLEEALDRPVRVIDWQRANSHFFTALQVERNVMFLILTLIILVAAFNIVSSLIMLVKDKTRQIAILRTMGATRGSIQRVFFLAGASIGCIGTLLGLVLGVAFCANIETLRQGLERLTGTELFAAEIYFLSRLPAKLDPVEVATVVGMALVLSFLATLYPAWRAARLDPVDALRYE